jgi:two-component system, LytTR family, response regulator
MSYAANTRMLRTLIVDDERPARSRLRRLLEPFAEAGRVEVVSEARDGVEALGRLEEGGVDLLLLDIQMPGLNGFDVLDRLSPDRRPVVVFVTAYDQYAMRAFDAAAVDYLLKPVGSDRLAAAVERAERLTTRDQRAAHEARLAELLEYLDRRTPENTEPSAEYLRHLSIPLPDRIAVVATERLVAAEVEDGLTRLYVVGEPSSGATRVVRHTVSTPLDALERRLDPERFVRVHRAAIVQLDAVREMIPWFSGRYKLLLAGGHEVIASRTRSKDLRDRLSF